LPSLFLFALHQVRLLHKPFLVAACPRWGKMCKKEMFTDSLYTCPLGPSV